MSRRPRLQYLTGLRGLAALYIVIYHAFAFLIFPLTLGQPLPWGTLPEAAQWLAEAWLRYGHEMLAIFFVLSGYCLMLPVAARPDGRLPNGVGGYLRRRAQRILPPYYGAVIASWMFIAAVPMLQDPRGSFWDFALPAFSPGSAASHLVLLHGVSREWAWKINTPLWSLSTEWIIYLLFPLLLLPVWRRGGFGLLMVTAWGAGLLPSLLAPEHHFTFSKPWYLGLFAVGMAAALMTDSAQGSWVRWRARLPWGWLTLGLAAVTVGVATFREGFYGFWAAYDALTGLTAASLMVWATGVVDAERPGRPAVLRVLESRPAVALGDISYSLYLLHFPIVAAVYLWLATLAVSAGTAAVLLVGGATGLTILCTIPFYVVLERPYQRWPSPKPTA